MNVFFRGFLFAFAAIQISVAHADCNDGDSGGGMLNINVVKTGVEQWTSAVYLINSAVVSALLPAGLELNPAAVTADGKYPVKFQVGQRTHLQITVNSFTAVKDAQENMATGIFNVRQIGGTKIYEYHINFLETLPIGVLIDRRVLGIASRMAPLTLSGTRPDNDNDGDDPQISLAVDPTIPPYDPATFLAKIKANFSVPASIIGVREGKFVCSVKTHDVTTVTGNPVKSLITINNAFAPGMAGQYDSANAISSMTVSSVFTNTGPVPCDP